MKRIFLTIFLSGIFILLTTAAAELEQDGRTSSGIALFYEKGSERDQKLIAEIRDMDRELTRLFRAPDTRGRQCRIIFSPAIPPGRIESVPGQTSYDVLLNDRFPAATDAELRGKLAGTLLALRFGIKQNAPLPDWITAGMEHIRQSNLTSGRISKNARYFPILRAMLGASTIPDWRNLVTQSTAKRSGIDLQVYHELSRVTLEILAHASSLTNNGLGDYAAGMLENRREPAELFQATLLRQMDNARPGTPADDLMRQAYTSAAFNFRTPLPANLALEQLPMLLLISYSRTGKDNKVIQQPGSYTDLPFLFQQKHLEAGLLRDRMTTRLREFNTGLPAEAAVHCENLRFKLEQITETNPEQQAKELHELYQKTIQALKKRQELETMLDNVERSSVSPFLLFENELREANRDNEVLTDAARDFVNQTEKKYLND